MRVSEGKAGMKEVGQTVENARKKVEARPYKLAKRRS